MTNAQFTTELKELDFPTHDEPELALSKLRGEIEGRLRWLEETLLPEYPPSARRRPGRALVEHSIIDEATFKAVSEILEAANPVVHGRRVDPSSAGIIIASGLEVILMLDTLVEATREKLKGLSPETQLIYRFLELPTRRRWSIAKEFGLSDPKEASRSRIEHSRKVFVSARSEEKLWQLWDMVAEEGGGLSKDKNPF